jgi:hypothetical protein
MRKISEKPIPQQPMVFFKADQSGYLLNEADFKYIKKPWLDIIEDMKQVFSQYIGDKLHSAYIYGEFAKGKTIKGVTDFWVLLVTKGQISIPWLDEYLEYVKGKYHPLTSRLMFKPETLERVMASESYKFSIKTEYVCIYGENLAAKIDRFKADSRLCFKSIRFEEAIPYWYQYVMAKKDDPELIRATSYMLGNLMLHAGFEICIDKEKKYTTDLYTCYRVFSKYYPNKEPLMRQAYYFMVEPTSDAEEVLEILNSLGKWMMAIIKLNKVEGEIKRRKVY